MKNLCVLLTVNEAEFIKRAIKEFILCEGEKYGGFDELVSAYVKLKKELDALLVTSESEE